MSERDDAALVYRFLRDHGPVDAVQIRDACFPTLDAGPPSTVKAVKKRSMTRALSAITFMRAQGVKIACDPMVDAMSVFRLVV